jgi:3D-(3,5/4)-trihydroxycyclohexane-1,2-dione acylhydrolase (decyclizing)
MKRRLTVAQAIIAYLQRQYSARDGKEQRFIEGIFGIFGHGNVAGIGQALEQDTGLKYYLCRNEQAMVHTATAYAKASFRLRTLACTTSIGPGATNMLTGAAVATVNRLPVLLLPGDIFARRNVAPVLQQLESSGSQDISVNDCFKPVSRYWDRLQRPEQLLTSLPEVMRVLTSPAEAGAVTLCLPQDVQTEAWDYPEEFFEKRVWTIPRNRGDLALLKRAAEWIRGAKKPLIVAGGGVLYSEASAALAKFAEATGIPVCETQAGKGALPYDHPEEVGAVGVTGTPGANILAREADLVLGIGTRYSDFTSASKTAFQNPAVRFVNINVAEFDSYKHSALPLTGDARATLEDLLPLLSGYPLDSGYREKIANFRAEWEKEVDRIYGLRSATPSQGEIIGAVNSTVGAGDTVVCAAGSLPGDLHKLWRTRRPGGYHMEYGYSCMGYEIAGGLGIKMADPSREVYVLLGDGSYLMMAQEIVTSIQEGLKLHIVLLDNHGFSSIGGLSRSCGNQGMGTNYRYRRGENGDGELLPVDFVANAASLGAWATRARSRDELVNALAEARRQPRTTVVVVETSYDQRVPGYESWWDVAIAEVSEREPVRAARKKYEEALPKERFFF